jgi:hypothetical protein
MMLKLETGRSPYGARLITDALYKKGDLICRITDYHITDRPTYQTVQVGPHSHIEELGILAYLNHSCQPNVIVDTTELAVYAARNIQPDEELTFFYPSTEWEMDRPFICLCGAPQCVRLVAGAKYLSIDTLSRYFINQHIREMAIAALNVAVEREALTARVQL